MLLDLLKTYNAAEADQLLVTFFSSSPRAKGPFRRVATRLNVQSGLSGASMYPQFPATASHGVALLLESGIRMKCYRTLQQFFSNLKRFFKAATGIKPPKILPPRR